jgi:hypothetical protein
MNKNTLIILAAVTLTVAIAAAVVTNQQRSPTELRKEPLLPELVADINEATSISLTGNRHKTLLERNNDTWTIANSDDYPALQDKVRGLLIDLSELMTLERKTRNPELYHRLDVQNPSEPDSNSVQVVVTDRGGNKLADVIIGKQRISRITNIQTGLYVRKPEEPHALLVEGSVDVSADKTAWFEPDIMDIAAARIREVSIEHPDGSILRAYRNSPELDFQLDDLPDGRRIASRTLLNRFASVLHELRASDVRARELFDFPASSVNTTIQTFDGMLVNVTTAVIDERHYAHFEFHYDQQAGTAAPPLQTPYPTEVMDAPETLPGEQDTTAAPSVEDEVAELRAQHNDWVYLIPQFKYELLSQTLENLTREVTE